MAALDSVNIDLQPRDLELLQGLFESRVLSLSHIAALYFEGRDEAAKKRVQKLKAAGFLKEGQRRVYERSLLFLTGKAFEFLRDGGKLTEYPTLSREAIEKRFQVSALTLRHELEVMDVKTAFAVAIRKTKSFSLAEFSTWPLLYQFKASGQKAGSRAEVTVKPDGFIRIHEEEPDGGLSEHTFFLEVDRSTETQDTLAFKASCYLDYYRSGGLAASHGQPRSAYKDFPFRVLVVCKSVERRDNAGKRMLRNSPPILTSSDVDDVSGNHGGPPEQYLDSSRGLSQRRHREASTFSLTVRQSIRSFTEISGDGMTRRMHS